MIKYYDRQSGEYKIEKVAGEKYLAWTYASPVGMGLLELLIKRRLFSKAYGAFCDTHRSVAKVKRFVEEFNIDMQQSVKGITEFASFNDFFTRKLTEQARPIKMEADRLISPGDGRLTVFENIAMDKLVQVKNYTYSLSELIGDDAIASKFEGGCCMILRLCPTDYHRFHFVDEGVCDSTIKIPGVYYSVNPIALEQIPTLFCRNKREWSMFHSRNFGDILHVEVGATCVGTIVQTYTVGKTVVKGEEKGYFKFGGSTTILFFEKNRIKFDKDLLEQTELGYETKVLMGEEIGRK